ncbi:hypothetical protein [Methanoculleus thermophilus]|uniref:Uncharacterized protein n=1 Tax=Methanoculleus thermophilus TaxID=2200 RepID=A0A1G9B8K7_9EURY|nr:hypothetical protein [Methanoculleus thermophilus]SDK35906.1 hypothetical protein SAMN04488571_10865 [Methanoculleus thermophilus]
MHKKNIASITLAAWMFTVGGLMYLLHASELKMFLAFTLVGFFIIVYMIHPMYMKPRYIRNVNRLAMVATVIFGIVIYLRVLELFN